MQYKDITIEDVKACESYKNLSDEDAQKVVDTIRTYTEIIYKCYEKGKLIKSETVKIVSITQSSINKAA